MIRSERLLLIPATVPMLRAALDGTDALAAALGADVPASWPPEFLDADAIRYTVDRLLDGGEAQEGWWMYFVCTFSDRAPETLVGSAGYKGPPDENGRVEVGYGIVHDHRRKGYGTEATRALLKRAFSHSAVSSVIAETLPSLEASIGVLNKVGFRFVGQGSEDGVIRFEMTREAFYAASVL